MVALALQAAAVGTLEPARPLVMEAAQAAAVVMVVVQVEPRQQTPGGVQGLGEQEPPALKVPVQAAASVAVQAEPLQHEPAGLLPVTTRLMAPNPAAENPPTRTR